VLSAGLLRELLAAREDRRLVSPASIGKARLGIPFSTTEVAIALGAVNALFLVFVLVQFRYLFGGRGLVEARTHLTYAEYARHGFFELVMVAVLVLLVLLAVDALLRGDGSRGAWVVRCLSWCLLVLVFVVMASALQRMRLYGDVYGLTELRIYAIGIIGWLAAVFLWFGITVLRGRRASFALGAVVAGFAATAILNVVNPDALIARTNLDRSRVDVPYVAGLSDDAVPEMLERLPSLRPGLRRALALELLRRNPSGGDWRSFNLARSHADALPGPASRRALDVRELVADDLDEPAPVARAVELDEEDALPGAEAKFAVPHWDRLAGGPHQHRHAVGVPVPELHVLGTDVLGAAVPVVVGVVLRARDEPAQEPHEVLEEARLELVHPHDARRVRRVDAGDTVTDAALGDAVLHFFRDVADLQAAPRPQTALLLEDLHFAIHLRRSRVDKIRSTYL
jgi:hypothetical protein